MSSKIAPSLGALLAALGGATGPAMAGDHGYSYHVKVHQHGSIVAVPSTTVLSYVAPSPLLYTTYAAPSYFLTPMVPVYPTYNPVPVAPASPAGSTLLKSASPAFSSPGATAQASATADSVAEYTEFLRQESVKYPATIYQAAGVRPHPSDVAALQQNHAQLSAVLGVERLASIGRFLVSKRSDPNFRANAFRLFEPLLGVYLPSYTALIDRFLDDLRQGPSTTDDRVPPAPSTPSPPPPSTPFPPPPSAPERPSLELVPDPTTGHYFATAPDGTRIEFDANRNPLSMTRPDGKPPTHEPASPQLTPIPADGKGDRDPR